MKDKYDVIIVGAGIGGLVCGCYLAKAGMKVLIAEKHDKPGGYCTSFKRKGYSFDVAIHYLGGCKEGGQINKILRELSIKDDIELVHYDPTDKIITPDYSILIRSDFRETISGLQAAFPKEKENLDKFFRFVLSKNFYEIYAKTAGITFRVLLDGYFEDFKLKAILSVVLGNVGLPESKVSALTAIVLYRDFILNPGFYPKNGMQSFADLFADTFTGLGGKLLLNCEIRKITCCGDRATGVELPDGSRKNSTVVVSNADAEETFKKLLEGGDEDSLNKIDKLKPSISAFAVYLGLKTDIGGMLKEKCAIWYFTTYDIDSCYGDTLGNMRSRDLNYIVCTFPSLHSEVSKKNISTMELFMGAPFKTKRFWEANKDALAEKAIQKAEKVIPGFSKYIDIKVIGTPHTFYRYTYNKDGAMYGWASTPDQIDKTVFPQRTKIDGLYLAGHWSTNGLGQGGISGVAYSGRHIAKIIENRVAKNCSTVVGATL